MEFLELIKTGKNSWWRYLVDIVVIFLFFVAGFLSTLILGLLNIINLPNISFDFEELVLRGVGPFGYFLPMTMAYAIIISGVFFCVRFLHKRHPFSLITSKPYFSWKVVFISFALYLFFSLLETGYYIWEYPHLYKINEVGIAKFVNFTISFFMFFSLQVLLEELIHRGYLLQLGWLLFRNKYLAILVSALIFMWGHNAKDIYTALYFMADGVILGIIVLLTNGLEIPLGVHFAHNFWTIFVIYYTYIPEEYNAGLLINTLSTTRSADLLDIFFVALKVLLIYIIIIKTVKDRNNSKNADKLVVQEPPNTA